MAFQLSANIKVRVDDKGQVRQLQHVDEPYTATSNTSHSLEFENLSGARQLAEQYLNDVFPVYRLNGAMLASLQDEPTGELIDASQEFRFSEEKGLLGNAVVSFTQTQFGVPVWNSAITVRMDTDPLQVVGSESTAKYDVNVSRPSPNARYLPPEIAPPVLASLLQIPAEDLVINAKTLFIYRYQACKRERVAPPRLPEQDGFNCDIPRIALPVLHESIRENRDYVVSEVLFSTKWCCDEVHWRVLVEVETGSVLYLRPLVGCCNLTHPVASVFLSDPITKTGNVAHTPGASNAILDGLRDTVDLTELAAPSAGANQELKGRFVKLIDITAPNPTIPTSPAPGDFRYNVASDNFSAVNAYYHVDRFFRLLESLGIPVDEYFDGTDFPVRVDHRATIGGASNTVNAQAPGNAFGNGSDGFRFALAQANTSVGISADWRVVLHEFGHAVLWDHLHSPNFQFAHSFGDAAAALLNDPGNLADRGRTFPWVPIQRRHDRTPQDGWAWGGPRDGAFTMVDASGYLAEQILSSTMFRLYRAAGGDSQNITEQQFAAHYVIFVLLKAVALMTPASSPPRPESLSDLMSQADVGEFPFGGSKHRCGALRKAIRWAFERQGAFQAPGALSPVMGPGAPPDVDVFIDDGRNGSYEYQDDHRSAPGIWVRNANDGLPVHQAPTVGSANYVYVRLHNRGRFSAHNAVVHLYEGPANESLWPNDWQLLGSPIPAAVSIPPGQSVVVGPLTWVPGSQGSALLADITADGDKSSSALFSFAKPISVDRFVALDNNAALRNSEADTADAPGDGSLEATSPTRRLGDAQEDLRRAVQHADLAIGVLTERLTALEQLVQSSLTTTSRQGDGKRSKK